MNKLEWVLKNFKKVNNFMISEQGLQVNGLHVDTNTNITNWYEPVPEIQLSDLEFMILEGYNKNYKFGEFVSLKSMQKAGMFCGISHELTIKEILNWATKVEGRWIFHSVKGLEDEDLPF